MISAFLSSMDDALDQLHPMSGLTGQQFFMLQVLLVQGRMGEVPLVPGTVLFSHFQGMEDMNFRAGHVDPVRQRRDQVGIELVFAAALRNVRTCAAHHFHKGFGIRAAFSTPLFHAPLQKAGFEHYEISNFCRPGKYSRHNSSYWKGIPYLGCGPSAHSFDGMTREWNVSSIDTYIKGIEENSRAFEIEYLDQTTRYNEFIITTIRTVWGTPIEKLKQMFGNEMWEYCQRMAAPYLKNGKLEEHDGALRLTREGIFISDSIMSDLLWVD